MPEPPAICQVEALTADQIAQLAEILTGVVAAGASVGYLPPLTPDEAAAAWQDVARPDNLLWIAEQDGRIVGTAQLQLALRPNGRHRAEVNKVLVHPAWQGQGIGRALMAAVETEARAIGRTLLHLDTRQGDTSNHLYRRCGWTEAGTIPLWAAGADGALHGTVIYFKTLDTR